MSDLDDTLLQQQPQPTIPKDCSCWRSAAGSLAANVAIVARDKGIQKDAENYASSALGSLFK